MKVVRERIAPFFAGVGTGELAVVALLAGLGEETLFRGVLQQALDGPLPTWVALLATAALFGAAHWVTPTYAFLAGLVGLYFGALYLLSDNLLAPIVAHALYDVVALTLLARMKPASSPSVV
jgi:membrane protease YdiL (CAAX protease family)